MPVRLKLTLLCWLLAIGSRATHIIGGEMYYDHLGGTEYLVTLDLYRDCGPNNTNGTGFDLNAYIGVFNSSGVLLYTTSLFFTSESNVPWVVNNPCLSVPPNVCVATTSYSGVFDLPPIAGGYVLAYQRCCRTPGIINLTLPQDQGLTCMITVPGVMNSDNSSPRFNEYPPIVLCMGEPMVIDHSANDPDGDVLEYEFCTPFHGADNINPMPLEPLPPPYSLVNWAPGYSANYPLDSSPAIAIDQSTGELTVTPSLIGSFTVGVRVKEYRNGVLLSEVVRDFKFEVVACITNIISAVAEQDPNDLCAGLTIQFQNESQNGQFWHWDFGDPNSAADTSSMEEPNWTYAQGGTYTVTLIANPGWPCADTSQAVFSTSQPMGPFFEVPPVLCIGEEFTLIAEGTLPANVLFQWTIPPSCTATGLNSQLLSGEFSEIGIHPITIEVSVGDCAENFTDSLHVEPFPQAEFTSESNACVGEIFGFQDASIGSGPMTYFWQFGDGEVSSESDPMHQYASAGTYTVSLTVATTEGCIAESTIVKPEQVVVYPLPVAGFRIMPNTVSLLDPEVEILDHAWNAVDWTYSMEGQTMHEPDFTYLFDGAGHVTVWQTVISEHGCRDSTSRDVFITDHFFFAPNSFTPNGDGINDLFAPVVKGARHYELIIFDRYGAEVFRTNDEKGAWSGDGWDQGMYAYKAYIAEFGTHRQEYRGHVTLLR
jgi:gliding motility-associated-like protein